MKVKRSSARPNLLQYLTSGLALAAQASAGRTVADAPYSVAFKERLPSPTPGSQAAVVARPSSVLELPTAAGPGIGATGACIFPQPAEEVETRDNATYQTYNFDNFLLGVTSLPIDENFLAFQQEVRQHVDPNPWHLIKRERAFFAGARMSTHNFDVILAGDAGTIGPVTCVEALLMSAHLALQSDRQTEFFALMLRRRDEVRVQFVSLPTPGGELSHLQARIKPDLAAGWQLWSHLHNHFFAFDNPYGDLAGATVPSPPDVFTYQMMSQHCGLAQGRITNGFDTLVLKATEFGAFEKTARS